MRILRYDSYDMNHLEHILLFELMIKHVNPNMMT